MKGRITACLLLITVMAQAQKPPKTNVVVTPVTIKAAPVKPAANEVWLNLQVTSGPDVVYWIQTAEQQPAPVQTVKRDSAAVEGILRQYQQATNTASKKLVVLLRSDARTPYTEVKPVMDALKGAGIYSYKLITDPETKQ